LKSKTDKLPKEAHYLYAFNEVYLENFQESGVFYLDLWPIEGIFQVVISPTAATIAMQTNNNISMSRPDRLSRFFLPIAGGPNLFGLPVEEWKPWRAIFTKGFNTEHCVSLVPGMVEETLVYMENLRSLAAKKQLFSLDKLTLRFMMDMIGRTIL
jgi:cytochrome P450